MSKIPRLLGQRALGFLLVVASLLLLLASPASAHTGFDSSSPADGETVTEPVAEISLTFTGEATPAGEGFVVLDADGQVRTPDEITSSDNLTWTLRFDEPLVDGVVGVRWRVAAPDAHPIDGSFSFTVDAPAIAADEPSTTEATSPPEGTTAPAEAQPEAADEPTTAPAAEATSEEAVTLEPTAAPVDLDEFLDTGDESASGVARVGDLGRALGLLGFVVAFGGVAFAALALRGNESDIRAVLFWVRRAGLLTIVGSAIAAAAQVAELSSSWSGLSSSSALSDALLTWFGLSVVLRIAGGALISTGAKLDVHSAHVAADPVASVKQFATVGAGAAASTDAAHARNADTPIDHADDDAWHISKSPAAFVGAALLAFSYLFDGHTVSEGPRALHALANAIHVMTAATWAGGVVMLAYVIARRHRRNADTRALQLAVRFSVVATIALVGAALAGTALSIVILDSVSEIWSTSWGQLLIVKTALVGVAAAGGGYNHRIVIPALERAPDDAETAHRFRSIVTLEAVALVAVTIVTALLIAASAS